MAMIDSLYRPFTGYFDKANLADCPDDLRQALEPIEIAFSDEGRNPLRATAAWTKDWWFTFLEGRGSAHVRGDEAQMSADYLLLVLTLSGHNRPGGTIRSMPRPGEMVLLPWTSNGSFISVGEFKYLFAFIPKADLVAQGCPIEALPLGLTVSALAGAGAPLASALRTLAMQASRPEGRDALACALPAISKFVADVFTQPTRAHIIKSRPEDRIDHIVAYLEDHLGLRDLTARQVAMACGLSIRQLFRSFEDRGVTFAERLRDIRLERACELLAFQPQLPIMQVAATTGFSSASHFTRTFRASLGTTPLQYRKRQGSYQKPDDFPSA